MTTHDCAPLALEYCLLLMKQQIEKERWSLLKSIERLLEGPITFLGFVWLILIIVELINGLTPLFENISIGIWLIFILDFLIKFIIAPRKLDFIKRNVLTIISLIIPAFRLLRLFRIFRVIRGVRLIKVVGSLNRSMRSLAATMKRRGFAYVVLLSVVVIFGGAAGMFAIEKGNQGFESYGMSLWWTSMRIVTAGSDYWPQTGEGRGLAFILALYGYAVFGYVTATLATFFIGRDAEEKDAPVAGSNEINELKKMIASLERKIDSLNKP